MLKLVGEVNEIYAAKGKKIIHFDLRREKSDTAVLAKVLLGPTPTLRREKTLIVGFDKAMYKNVFG